jgi:hypothetical protein
MLLRIMCVLCGYSQLNKFYKWFQHDLCIWNQRFIVNQLFAFFHFYQRMMKFKFIRNSFIFSSSFLKGSVFDYRYLILTPLVALFSLFGLVTSVFMHACLLSNLKVPLVWNETCSNIFFTFFERTVQTKLIVSTIFNISEFFLFAQF